MGFIRAVKWRNDFRILLDCRAVYTDCVCVCVCACERAYLETPQSYAPYFLVHTFLAWETKEKCSNLWLYSNPPEGIKHKECVELQHKTGANPAVKQDRREKTSDTFFLFIDKHIFDVVCLQVTFNLLETGE